MNQIWNADIDVPPHLAAACIDAQFPELAPAKLTVLGEGWDNVAFAVNDAYVFRFPRRKVAVPLLNTESALLPWLAPQLSIPIPQPIFLGKPTAEYPYPFTGYRFLAGNTACGGDLSDAERSALAMPLAKVLRTLHCADAGKARELGVGGDGFGRFDVSRQVGPARDRIASLVDRGHLKADIATRLVELLVNTPTNLPVRADTLVHGDLYAQHILIASGSSGTPTLAGIIDWGDLYLGDPAVDLAVVFGFLPATARGLFWSSYAIPDNRTHCLARYRAICGMSSVAHYAAEIRETNLLREGLRGLGNVAIV